MLIFGLLFVGGSVLAAVGALEALDAGVNAAEGRIGNYGIQQRNVGYQKGAEEGAQAVEKVTKNLSTKFGGALSQVAAERDSLQEKVDAVERITGVKL